MKWNVSLIKEWYPLALSLYAPLPPSLPPSFAGVILMNEIFCKPCPSWWHGSRQDWLRLERTWRHKGLRERKEIEKGLRERKVPWPQTLGLARLCVWGGGVYATARSLASAAKLPHKCGSYTSVAVRGVSVAGQAPISGYSYTNVVPNFNFIKRFLISEFVMCIETEISGPSPRCLLLLSILLLFTSLVEESCVYFPFSPRFHNHLLR